MDHFLHLLDFYRETVSAVLDYNLITTFPGIHFLRIQWYRSTDIPLSQPGYLQRTCGIDGTEVGVICSNECTGALLSGRGCK